RQQLRQLPQSSKRIHLSLQKQKSPPQKVITTRTCPPTKGQIRTAPGRQEKRSSKEEGKSCSYCIDLPDGCKDRIQLEKVVARPVRATLLSCNSGTTETAKAGGENHLPSRA